MVVMHDSTAITDIPLSAVMVGYYVDGRYAVAEATVRARFPFARLVGISATGSDAGQVGDVETGDLTPAQFPGWCARRRLAGVEPIGYCNRSNLAEVRRQLALQAAPWIPITVESATSATGPSPGKSSPSRSSAPRSCSTPAAARTRPSESPLGTTASAVAR